MPGVAVAIGVNSPRISAGASGLGSQLSWWLMPPQQKITMHDFALPPPLVAAAALCSRRKCGSDNPAIPAKPTSAARRDIPAAIGLGEIGQDIRRDLRAS